MSGLLDLLLAGVDQPQADQLNSLAKGVGKVIYTPHTMEPLKELVLYTHTATKLAMKHILSSTLLYLLALDAFLSIFLSILITETRDGVLLVIS
eukprot:1160683-Pelagomonas_calceolata.AAC.4